MIPARRVKIFSNWFAIYMRYRMRKAFNQLMVMPFIPKEGHSILLLCNHFSWWDGLWGNYLAYWHLDRKLYIMMQEDHLKINLLKITPDDPGNIPLKKAIYQPVILRIDHSTVINVQH